VVAESRAPRDGAYVEVIGWYNPQADPAQVVVNTEKAEHWIARGAQPSDRVAYLLRHAGVGAPAQAEPAAPSEPAAKPARRPTARPRASKATGAAAGPVSAEATEEGAAAESVDLAPAENSAVEAAETDASAADKSARNE